MIEKVKKNKHQIIELAIIFILTLTFSLVCNRLQLDEIWSYGFAYNISTGLIPYKDFNMVITPLFPLLGALFLTIFGKSLVVFHILNSLICTAIFFYMKKFIPKSYYFAYAILLSYSFPNYNLFCILLLYILMNMEKKKSNDYLIGIVLGLTFLTKQNIGIYLCIPTLFIKDIKRMFKRGIGFIIPNLIMLVYLLINNNIYEFIDYTFLGISSFAKENTGISYGYLTIVIISILYLIYQYIKNKDINIIYLISFQLLVFPLVENYHVMIAIIPTLGYLISKIPVSKKFIVTAFIIFITAIISLNIYSIYKGDYSIPNKTDAYKYRRLEKYEDIAIKDVIYYMNKYEGDLYIISRNAYTYKLEANIPINKYDLLNNGNLGNGGPNKIIDEIDENCHNKKCVFFVNENELSKDINGIYNKDILIYVITNYDKKEKIHGLSIYNNY